MSVMTVAVLAGVLCATAVSVIVFGHNPQGEFADTLTGAVQWDAVLPLLGLAFVVPFGAIVLLGAALYLLRRLTGRKIEA